MRYKEGDPRVKVGTYLLSKSKKFQQVVDIWTTFNEQGEIVNRRYLVATKNNGEISTNKMHQKSVIQNAKRFCDQIKK